MAPVYKLKYFNFMGVAEPIRYLLAYGNIQYENVVVTETEWVKTQKVVPFAKLPLFEVDNKCLYHSVAICKYLAKLVGLLPVDDWEVAELDSVAEIVYGLGSQTLKWYEQVNPEFKTYVGKELTEFIIPKYLNDLEEILKKKGHYFGGKKFCWVDFYVVGILESVQLMVNKNFFQNQYPTLYQLWNDIRSVPAIKTYIAKRPNYKY